ncbi:pilus assembly PilX family protein [Thiocapsa bogorovii]|uniref:pilus assembly PilX family protein n=1 Tax=Thiocapsa bogorovii TaxID=521689 RepID=UPI001E2D5023|nr:pilus assembly PilX N-terminal domain-containing protein [Thiocapsa bogorovii]UHD16155.1 pilus assembly PilX N-terminal domain-containing protein [Thiocapsa bogorovii]
MDGHRGINSRHSGAVLIIALIMLLVTTLIGISVFEMGSNNLVVVANLESREQTRKAAEDTLEVAIENLALLIESLAPDSPKAVFFCEGHKNHQCHDIDGDGLLDIEVSLTDPQPSCMLVTPTRNDELDVTDINDQGCFIGTQQGGAVDGAGATGQSMCSASVWDLRAVAVDVMTQAEARVRQGVSVRVSNNDVATECP